MEHQNLNSNFNECEESEGKKYDISIIVPCYNEEKTIELFYKELKKVFNELPYSYEILFVDDGSKDSTLIILKQLVEKDIHVSYLSFSRNFGKESAMYAGFCNVSGKYVAVMDADLQDPPELLPKMIEILNLEEYDSVATRRENRNGEPPVRSWFAKKYYQIKIISLSNKKQIIPIPESIGLSNCLNGKNALIVGGTGGIGLAIAKEFLSCGANVIIAGTNEEKLCKVEKEINSDNLKHLKINVLDVKTLKCSIISASKLFSNGSIDILVNSFGIMSQSDFVNVTEEEYDKVLDVNLKGLYFICQATVKYMMENHIRGHILNISSSSALRPAWSPYNISKWGVSGFTKGLADEAIRYGIVVNAIGPGPTATNMLMAKESDDLYHPTNPSGRFVVPSEVAHLAVFMVSDYGNMIVGDTYFLSGGGGTITLHR